MRVSVVGNTAGGKSTLSARIADCLNLPLWELDAILWRKGWIKVEESVYLAEHQKIIDTGPWVVDGLGLKNAFRSRIARSTHVLLVDLPLWQHHWLAAERHLAFETGKLTRAPGGLDTMPLRKSTHGGIDFLEREYMPELRRLCEEAVVPVFRIGDVEELSFFDIGQLSVGT